MDVDTNHQLLLVWSVHTLKASTSTHYTVHVHIPTIPIYIYTQIDVFHTHICTVYTHTPLTVNQHGEEQRWLSVMHVYLHSWTHTGTYVTIIMLQDPVRHRRISIHTEIVRREREEEEGECMVNR